MNLQMLQTRLQDQCELSLSRPLLAGISGGPDSLCLLHVLWKLGYRVIVAHYNHGLRPEAGEDAEVVKNVAEKLGVQFVLGEGDVASFGKLNHLSVEEAARIMRYRFLFSEAQKWHAQAVAVAHTADDQVETVLMHLLRGAGLAGLKGMAFRGLLPEWSRDIPLVRPLLDVWRDDIMAYCQANQLEPVIDATNLNPAFYRNRLRLELIPFLSTYNPQVKEVIWRMSQSLSRDYEVLEVTLQSAWERCLLSQNESAVMLSRPAILKEAYGLQWGILRKGIAALRPDMRDIDYDTIERAIALICQPPRSRQSDLISGLRLAFEDDRVVLSEWGFTIADDEWLMLTAGQALELAVPGAVALGDKWLVECHEISLNEWTNLLNEKNDPHQAWLDLSSLSMPLQVRTRQPGDRFRPLGMGGHSLKISDFWVNKKLPRRARASWPLVCSGNEIAWIPGFRPGEPFKVNENTQRVLHLQLSRRN